MNITMETIILILRVIGGVALVPGILTLMAALLLRLMHPPKDMARRIAELTEDPPPPEPIPIDLSDLKRIIRPYIPQEDVEILQRLFDEADNPLPAGWETTQ